MNRVNLSYLVAGAILFGVALVIGWQGMRLQFYSFLGPGAGFFPTILAVLLGLLSLALAVQAVVRPRTLPQDAFGTTSASGLVRILTVTGMLMVVAVSFETVGFPLIMAGFFFVVFLTLSGKGLLHSIVLSLVVSAAYYLFFREVLRVHLPTGLLGW